MSDRQIAGPSRRAKGKRPAVYEEEDGSCTLHPRFDMADCGVVAMPDVNVVAMNEDFASRLSRMDMEEIRAEALEASRRAGELVWAAADYTLARRTEENVELGHRLARGEISEEEMERLRLPESRVERDAAAQGWTPIRPDGQRMVSGVLRIRLRALLMF
ncbi:uncharacterized protein BDZ99DRAFT_464030 [Mytilinidion resinicola]|uniref:Uncharacterized protein n=1 Tax=Mytilinidion resinicola TaxID=574789 RepID=A0A6A6YL19_9PEZI|nr:uncharacterized protein BDZ99DRAFT_464030 [Mytilinidion resinicola]KAF2809253.1 hypothetical protein BDZ99DRAFT_464030 [Mytilinidion resinicola]